MSLSVAIRPELDFSTASTETSLPDLIPIPYLTLAERESSLSTLSTGVSGLFYLTKSDGLGTYLSPRFSYSWISYDNSFSVAELGEPSSSSYTLGGFFGVQYAPVRRFSVFGEVGIAGTSGKTTFDFDLSSETSVIGLRAGVGMVLYFR
jgi:hypothetical protein